MINDKPILIVGLGNPGAEYARTRHNAGFMAVDAIAGDSAVWKKEKNSLTTKSELRGVACHPCRGGLASEAGRGGASSGNKNTNKIIGRSPPSSSVAASGAETTLPPYGGETRLPVIFAKPQTFMNDSGIAVAALMKYYKIPLENLIVIHDDMDIKPGDIRVKTGGGSAGHNGIKSIDAAVTIDYERIRIGIGHPRDYNSPIDPYDWVLGKFSGDEIKQINEAIEKVKQVINKR